MIMPRGIWGEVGDRVAESPVTGRNGGQKVKFLGSLKWAISALMACQRTLSKRVYAELRGRILGLNNLYGIARSGTGIILFLPAGINYFLLEIIVILQDGVKVFDVFLHGRVVAGKKTFLVFREDGHDLRLCG